MATAEVTVRRPAQTTSERVTRFLAKTPVHIALLIVAFVWLLPTVGLAITSVRVPADITSTSWWIVALMVVPIQMALVPLLRLFRDLGIANNLGGIILAHTAFGLPLGIFLLRNFFITLPRDLIEAARVDGASNLRIFSRVVIPLSVPALASYAIFQFLWVWNDLLMALVFVQNSDLWPMTIRINQIQSQFGIEWHLLSAARSC
jgi:alpha-glucoside transport system permease protein